MQKTPSYIWANTVLLCFSPPVFAQPIVSRAKPEMLKSHFIPTMEKLKKRSSKVVAEEEHLRMEGKTEVDSENGTIRDEFAVLCRDLYALYPLLIRYVDNNRWDEPVLSLCILVLKRSRCHFHPRMSPESSSLRSVLLSLLSLSEGRGG